MWISYSALSSLQTLPRLRRPKRMTIMQVRTAKKEITDCQKLSPIAPVLPALRLGFWCCHPDLAGWVAGDQATHNWRNLIHPHVALLPSPSISKSARHRQG